MLQDQEGLLDQKTLLIFPPLPRGSAAGPL
jgi:hypothetical protein